MIIDAMDRIRIYVSITVASCIVAQYGNVAYSQTQNVLRGKIINGVTHEPVDFAIVYIKEANVIGNAPGGQYAVAVKKPGKYTVQVQSSGFQNLVTTVTIEGVVLIDFTLNSTNATKADVVVRGERDIQKISRQTMTVKQIKEVPASFGDSINALSSLPGVNRPSSFFGSLIIRGADSSWNGYYIDGIPLFSPMHFGGLHSVINNDLMSEIDLYSSAFPAQFGNSQAAVININTIDEVKRFGGNADIGILSANALIKMPIMVTDYSGDKTEEKNKGYMIAAGRYGYLSLFIPTIAKVVFNKDISILPNYWDYQIKIKYELDKANSLTILAFGSKDYWDIVMKSSYLDPGADPMMAGASYHTNQSANSAGLYYTYKPCGKIQNTLMGYTSLTDSVKYFDLPQSTNDALRNIHISSKPYIYGLKDDLKFTWWKDRNVFRTGLGFTYYDFRLQGKSISTVSSTGGQTIDSNDYIAIPLDEKFANKVITWYAENKLTYGGFTFVPGYHSEYMMNAKKITCDPRGMISYTFKTGTTIGIAGGWYSMFLQTSPDYFTTEADIAGAAYLKPQRSIHRSLSFEQRLGDFTFRAEGYYNNFWDLVENDVVVNVDGTKSSIYRNSGKAYSEGIEFLFKLSDEADQGFFGWVSYTLNRAKYITHQSAAYTEYGEEWLTSPYDMTHIVKLVAGYTSGRHTISTRYQYNTATPYTQIIGSQEDTAYETAYGKTRIIPIYGKPNTARLNPEYRLDIRYSCKTGYKWGYVSWYFEFIGIVRSKSEMYTWDYRYPYSSTNPYFKKSSGMSSIPIPNFGVEVKF